MRNLTTLLESPPSCVPLSEVVHLDGLDDRVCYVNILHANLIGIGTSGLEWSPNFDPPTLAERLAWVWVLRPDLSDQILDLADSELRQAIVGYEEGR